MRDVEGSSHLTLPYHLHLAREPGLTARPFLDTEPRGIFATRSSRRPNASGLSTVRLVRVEGRTLRVEDVVDGTPLPDIKPYIPAFDDREGARIGWFEGKVERVFRIRADERFRW